jgi:hypothetical protein
MANRKIALVFDFDDTLAPDSTSAFLDHINVPASDFWEHTVNPLLAADWDPVPAYLYSFLELSRSGKAGDITQERLVSFGESMPLFAGVEQLTTRLSAIAHEVSPIIQLEFYIISSGIGDIIRNSAIAGLFTNIWASEFHCDAWGRIVFPSRIVSFTDKTRYLFHINKGLIGQAARGNPYEVNRRTRQEDVYIPFNQMIYLGDGYTDVPCFSLIKSHHGFPIGVYDRNNKYKMQKAWRFISDDRVSNLLSADYSENSDLMNSLGMAVRSIAERIIGEGK